MTRPSPITSDVAAFTATGPAPFDLPVPRDLMVALDLDEIAGAVGRFEADPRGLSAHAPYLASLAARLTALAAAPT
jgi:hypothetical protein